MYKYGHPNTISKIFTYAQQLTDQELPCNERSPVDHNIFNLVLVSQIQLSHMSLDELIIVSQSLVFYLLMGSLSFVGAIVIHGILKSRRNENK